MISHNSGHTICEVRDCLLPAATMSTITTFRSVWDWSTYTILALSVAICFIPAIIEPDIISVIIGVALSLPIIFTFITTYYQIKGDTLIVRCALISGKYPISKIASIAPTSSILSAPAPSMTQRIAITFTDRKVLKSAMPLVISPTDRQDFINMLTSITPNIEITTL